MAKRVTIQDIADELGLSRNTVSKALNSAAGISDRTRERIIQKALEMGYRQFVYTGTTQGVSATMPDLSLPMVDGPNEVALLTTIFLDRSHFASLTLDALQNDLAKRGYVLNTHRVTKDDLRAKTLPLTLRLDNTVAILCIEMFDHAYSNMICDLGKPTLFFDGPTRIDSFTLRSDQILMDNTAGISQLVSDLLARDVTRIGFVGNWNHCQSFFERYLAFRSTMMLAGVPVDERWCVPCNKEARIYSHLSSVDELPQLFVCANDFVAFDLLRAVRRLNISVPDDLLVSGFDDSTESRNWEPTLTTVHIHTQSIAYSAMQLLVTRLQEPTLGYRRLYTQADLICRHSTDLPLED